MNVKLTNNQIMSSMNTLTNLSKKELPVRVSYAIAKNIIKLDKLCALCESEKMKLVNQYGPKDADGKLIQSKDGMVQLSPENIPLYNDSYSELLDIENDVDIHQFSIDLIENYDMKPEELVIIDFMIME